MKKAKLNIYRSVLLVVDGMVVQEKGKTVNSTPLFSEYLKHAERWGVQISKDEFCERFRHKILKALWQVWRRI